MVCHLDFPKNPFRQFPKTHYSSVPSFQHSNWGVAPKFYSYTLSSLRPYSVSPIKSKHQTFRDTDSLQRTPSLPARRLGAILCTAINCVCLSIGLSVVHSTLFIIGVLECWNDGPKELFDISKLLFQILQHSGPTYWDHIQDLKSSNYDRLKYKTLRRSTSCGRICLAAF